MIKTTKNLIRYGINLLSKEYPMPVIELKNKLESYKRTLPEIEKLNIESIESREMVIEEINKLKGLKGEDAEFIEPEIAELKSIQDEIEMSLDENIEAYKRIEKAIKRTELMSSTYILKYNLLKSNFDVKELDFRSIFDGIQKDIDKLKRGKLARTELKSRLNK